MNITPAESRVMEALWRCGPLALEDLISQIRGQSWGEATVKTLVHRLIKRKAVQSKRIDGRIRYAPTIERTAYIHAESQNFLDRLFDGHLAPLVAHFADQRAIPPEDVKRLKSLLEKLEDGE